MSQGEWVRESEAGREENVNEFIHSMDWIVSPPASAINILKFQPLKGTAASQAPLSMGFSRQEYWSGSPSPGDLLAPGIEPWSLALQADSLSPEPPGKGNICLFTTTAPDGQGLQEPSDEKSHFNFQPAERTMFQRTVVEGWLQATPLFWLSICKPCHGGDYCQCFITRQ